MNLRVLLYSLRDKLPGMQPLTLEQQLRRVRKDLTRLRNKTEGRFWAYRTLGSHLRIHRSIESLESMEDLMSTDLAVQRGERAPQWFRQGVYRIADDDTPLETLNAAADRGWEDIYNNADIVERAHAEFDEDPATALNWSITHASPTLREQLEMHIAGEEWGAADDIWAIVESWMDNDIPARLKALQEQPKDDDERAFLASYGENMPPRLTIQLDPEPVGEVTVYNEPIGQGPAPTILLDERTRRQRLTDVGREFLYSLGEALASYGREQIQAAGEIRGRWQGFLSRLRGRDSVQETGQEAASIDDLAEPIEMRPTFDDCTLQEVRQAAAFDYDFYRDSGRDDFKSVASIAALYNISTYQVMKGVREYLPEEHTRARVAARDRSERRFCVSWYMDARALNSPAPTVKELAEKLDCSTSTVYRDMRYLREQQQEQRMVA